MSALEVLGVCGRTGAKRVKVAGPAILTVGLNGAVEVEEISPPNQNAIRYSVVALRKGRETEVGWRLTQKGAEELVKDLTGLGVTCTWRKVEPEPPRSAL